MNENGGKSSTILLTVIGIATLLVVVTGATFAYFAAIVNGNDKASTIQITASREGTTLTFQGGDAITLTGIYPREEKWATRDISLSNTPIDGNTRESVYTFKLVVDELDGFNVRNTDAGQEAYTDSDNLKFEFISKTATNVTGATGTPLSKITDFDERTIGTGTVANNKSATIVYTLNVYYKNDDAINQNTGADNRTFRFHIEYDWKANNA